MKLSEFSTDRACDVMCALTPYISSIAVDNELLATLKEKLHAETRADMLLAGVEKFNKVVPILLKEHREDVFGILAVLNDTTAEVIGKQNFIKTMTQIRDIANDKELMTFFRSCAESEEKE